MKDLSCKYNYILMDYDATLKRKHHIGDMIYAYREKHNLSRDRFAKYATAMSGPYGIKVTGNDIWRYENHICCPKTDKLAAIRNAMFVSYPKVCGFVAKHK